MKKHVQNRGKADKKKKKRHENNFFHSKTQKKVTFCLEFQVICVLLQRLNNKNKKNNYEQSVQYNIMVVARLEIQKIAGHEAVYCIKDK